GGGRWPRTRHSCCAARAMPARRSGTSARRVPESPPESRHTASWLHCLDSDLPGPQIPQPVAQLRGALELEALGGLAHLGLELLEVGGERLFAGEFLQPGIEIRVGAGCV